MQATEDLFKLIKSLSKSEKRRFKLAAKRAKDADSNNYARLFDAIAAQESYDEEALKAEFRGEALLNNFSVAKAYLYDAVLSSLRNAKATLSPEMKLRLLLDQIEVLHKRGLPEQAEKCLKKGLRIAQSQALLPYEAELRRWQRRLVNLHSEKDSHAALAQVEAAEKAALRGLLREARLRSIRAHVQAIFLNQIDLRRPEIAELLEQLTSDPVLAEEPSGNDLGSFHARLAFRQIHAIHARLRGLPAETLGHYKAAIAVWEEHPEIIGSMPDQYLVALTNFLDSCMRAHDFGGFLENLDKLKGLSLKNPRLKARAFYLGNHLELRFAISTGQLELGISKVAAIEAGLEDHARYLNSSIELTFLYNLAVIHFLARDFRGAIRFANRILNRPSSLVRQDLMDGARLFELAAHFELGNYDLLESLLRSMRRRLRQRSQRHPFEAVLVKGLRKLMAEPESGHAAIFMDLKGEFVAAEGASHLVAREELLIWIRSKLEDRPEQDLLVELARSRPT